MSATFRVVTWCDGCPHDEHPDAEVWVDVAKVEAAWLRGGHAYVGPGAPTDQHYRYERFGQFLATTTQPIHRSVIHHVGAGIGFTDGRHRFAWLRDHGVLHLPISTSRDDATAIAAMCGTSVRECRLPLPVTRRSTLGRARV